MTIPFDIFFQRVVECTNITTQMDLARSLGVNRSAVTQAKTRNAVPVKWLLHLSRQYGLAPDWLEFGVGRPYIHTPEPTNLAPMMLPVIEQETVTIPKVSATLCAGGGSLEVEAVPVAEYPLPRSWLARMGSPKDMVFMDVIGNSMEPGICDGDMVLVDQSRKEIVPKTVLAVGYDNAIYIKRLEKRPGGLTMLSDNPDYAPVMIDGDELNSFRVVGKVVWLCRDCRYA